MKCKNQKRRRKNQVEKESQKVFKTAFFPTKLLK